LSVLNTIFASRPAAPPPFAFLNQWLWMLSVIEGFAMAELILDLGDCCAVRDHG
jgi:hypothetical protein